MPKSISQTEQRSAALSVPLDAVDRGASAVRVYTVNNAGVIHIVPVTLGIENDRRVEIRSGLNEGDVVVVAAAPACATDKPLKSGNSWLR